MFVISNRNAYKLSDNNNNMLVVDQFFCIFLKFIEKFLERKVEKKIKNFTLTHIHFFFIFYFSYLILCVDYFFLIELIFFSVPKIVIKKKKFVIL